MSIETLENELSKLRLRNSELRGEIARLDAEYWGTVREWPTEEEREAIAVTLAVLREEVKQITPLILVKSRKLEELKNIAAHSQFCESFACK